MKDFFQGQGKKNEMKAKRTVMSGCLEAGRPRRSADHGSELEAVSLQAVTACGL